MLFNYEVVTSTLTQISRKTHRTIFLRPGIPESIDIWEQILKKISRVLGGCIKVEN